MNTFGELKDMMAKQLLNNGTGVINYGVSGNEDSKKMNEINEPPEGFYYLTSPDEPEPILVHGYKCTDLNGKFVFGFNTHDGGSLVELSDLKSDATIMPVTIMPASEPFIVHCEKRKI